MKLLVTAGATREAIDPVRYLSNVSTGETGAALATALAEHGHHVTLLHGAGAARPSGLVTTQRFGSAADLQLQLQALLATGDYAAVIMAAAVADYRPAAVALEKLSSEAETLTLNLVRNAKILPQLRGFSPRPLLVIGFKLTVGADEAAREKAVVDQFSSGTVDVVVQNDLVEMQAATEHPFRLFIGRNQAPLALAGVPALARALEEFIAGGAR
ncbi:MAG: DNA/pantothenate metabolism flavoprotein [Cephaloticoccus sp.]|nr:DNA/pantothenate metabolism flavoprotein [Cephaloticoccus sp.]MCF7760855.1 DNA/pantothenate metabolism flavoprotein [Cephaloticoccus sp.]